MSLSPDNFAKLFRPKAAMLNKVNIVFQPLVDIIKEVTTSNC